MKGMLYYGKLYALTLGFLILFDYLWLNLVMGGFYRSRLEPIGRIAGNSLDVHVPTAIASWLLVALGLVIFVLPRAREAGSDPGAILWGALFGLIVYGVYDFTNYAILKDWPLSVTVADILWGIFVCGLMGLLVSKFGNWLA
ncbi:MAG: DUF2177 family protein [Deltaproteobacteria bacterium]|nr:DUF2177 family protein [Deltaproteobacteria bacterium]